MTMTVNDFRAIVQGVEQAEAAGDHATAERLLRQALTLQEASAGPNHPDVANILNNLAIVCELNGKLTDAEACYRRAYAIATASLPPGDPFVTTSRENLEQFCMARGVPLNDTPSAASSPVPAASSAPAPAASSAPPPRPGPPPKIAAPPPKTAAPPPKAGGPPRATPPRTIAPPSLDDFPLRTAASAAPVATARTRSAQVATREPASRAPLIAVALAVIVLLLVGGWYLIDSNPLQPRAATGAAPSTAPPPAAPSPAPAEPVREPDPTTADAAAATPQPEPEPVAPTPAPAATAPAAPSPPAAAPEPPAATARTSAISVVTADPCRSLTRSGAWTCTPPDNPQAPGLMYFYTKVASPSDATIEHRWYRDGRLEQRVPLRIRANPSGFRTYSQTRINPDKTGAWKVEIRTEDGELLVEKAFTVRQ
jgi:hypothetical protein